MPNMSKWRQFPRLLIGLTLVIFFLVGTIIGTLAERKRVYGYLDLFSDVFSIIKANYVEEINTSFLLTGALRGAVESLDPFSSFIDRELLPLLQKEAPPADSGILLAKDRGYPLVVSLLPGSPADTTGIEVGDYLQKINGRSTRDLPLVHAQFLLSGEPGVPVTVQVIKGKTGEEQELTITLAEHHSVACVTRSFKNRISYLQLSDFSNDQIQCAEEALDSLAQDGGERLILDLRNNSSTDYEGAVRVADLFLHPQKVGTLERSTGVITTFRSFRKPLYRDSLAVLIGTGTLDGGELLSAALQESRRGILVGEKTFGKGTVHQLVPLGDGTAIMLAVAYATDQEGKRFFQEGVAPDIAVQNERLEDGTLVDHQLVRAIQELLHAEDTASLRSPPIQ